MNALPVRRMTVAAAIAQYLQSIANCLKTGNKEWEERHRESLRQIVRDFLPSGSGWDCGTEVEMADSTPEKIILYGSYHHMDEHGGYDGWTAHSVVVKPSFNGLDVLIRITGRDRNAIKEYLHQMFYHALTWEIEQQREEPYRWKSAPDRYEVSKGYVDALHRTIVSMHRQYVADSDVLNGPEDTVHVARMVLERIHDDMPHAAEDRLRLFNALKELVLRCDGEEGVRADGSNIQTMAASALLRELEGRD